jgi:NADH:ubiquinone oxidoreductase subunit E
MPEIALLLDKYPRASRDNLVPILQEIQDITGYITEEAVIMVGKHLNLPASKIYSLASYYDQFRFQPLGKYHIQVCRGTACHVLGSSTVLEELEKKLKIKAGQTSRSGLYSLEVVSCLGACSLAPVIVVNSQYHTRLTIKALDELVHSLHNE